MLTNLTLAQWRSHKLTTVPLSNFTLVVGPNGVGKSSVLEALSLLGRPFDTHLSSLLNNDDFTPLSIRKIHRAGATKPSLAMVHYNGGTGWEYGLQLGLNGAIHESKIIWESPPGQQHSQPANLVLNVRPDRQDWPAGLAPEVLRLCSTVLLKLDPVRLAEPSKHDATFLETNGYGLATVLAEMKLNDTPRFDLLLNHMRKVVPILRDLSFGRTHKFEQRAVARRDGSDEVWRVERVQIQLRTLHLSFADAPSLPADAASEGTLLVLGVLAALLHPTSPKLLLLDDLDRALHPRAQRLLAESLKALQTSFGVQIVATTHSPYLIDAFEASSVVVLTREGSDDGMVVAHRLCDHPMAKLLDAFQTGEFWTAHGEKGWSASSTAP